jgi:hypothetical protein
MKTNRLSVLCLAGALLLTGVSFTSCLKGDDVDTNQYVGGISLNVFGPSPVARGGELRFLGSGMNQVTAVVIPGCADITDINVISDREIRITVPQEAQPGLVTLRTPNGDITTRTELTFTEPISIENFTPATVLPGDELTIEGEYLNLIHEVIFADDVTVTEEDFITHERNMIKLLVPEEAQTGQIILSDGEELPNLIYSEEDLVVTLPSVETVVNKENAKPGDVVEINGENLDLVRQMLMPDGTEVEFTLTSPNIIEFILPENASDGDVVVVPASGVKVTVAHLTMAVPTNLVATPASGLRGGDEIVLTGLNLDVVTSLSFPGVAENVQPASLSEKELTVVMPEAAQSGSLILNTKSGKQVSIVIETLKPLVGSYNPSSIPAGESLLINGQNLDASVTFGGGQTVAVSSSSASQLSVSVPMEAETGNIVLNMYNGETVEAPSLTVTKPQCCYVMNLPEKVDAGALLELEVANGDKLTQVNVNGSQVQFILRDSKLMISLPAETVGEAALELVSSNGSISYQIEIVGSMGTLIYEGPLATGSWANSAQISSNMFATAQVGQVITVVVSDLQAGAQGSFKNSSWAAIAPGTEYFNIDGNFSLTITQDILTQLQSGGLIISGQNYTIESVYIK